MTPSEQTFWSALESVFARNFTNITPMPPERWAEDVRRMENGRRFRWSYAPYLYDMYMSLFDPHVIETVFMLFSRAGKSEVVLNAIGYLIDQQPCKMLSLWPTNANAEKWSKENLTGELFDTTDCLSALSGKGGKRSSKNTILHKEFPGGLIDIFGANAPGDMRRAKGAFLYSDEIDAQQSTEADEGDQGKIFDKRGDEFPDCIRVAASYPSLKGKSRIVNKMMETDWNKLHVICLKCGGEPWVMVRTEHLKYDRANTSTARLECPRCHELLDDRQRHTMVVDPNAGAEWIPTLPFRGRRGFHANSLLWPHPVSLKKYPGGYLQILADREIAIEKSDNPERSKRVFINTEDAEPYEAPEDRKADPSDMYQRREHWKPQKLIPEGVLYITAGNDWQKNRGEIEFVGWGLNGESWGLGYYVMPGEVMSAHPWAQLEKHVKDLAWETEKGRVLKCEAVGVDSGKWGNIVYAFTRSRYSKGFLTMKGSSTLGVPIIGKPSKVGRPSCLLFIIGTHEAKEIIYQNADLSPMRDETTGEVTCPHGYMHYPAIQFYDEKYFQGLLVESSTHDRGPDGKFYRRFTCPEGVRNEPIDCRVYAYAASVHLKKNVEQLALDALNFVKDPPPKEEESPKPRKSFVLGSGTVASSGRRGTWFP